MVWLQVAGAAPIGLIRPTFPPRSALSLVYAENLPTVECFEQALLVPRQIDHNRRMATGRKKNKTNAPLADPTALAKFGKLEVVARLVVEGYMMGQHKSPFKGSSIEFVEHRQYYPGDEIRHIDWRAYGKTGKYYIKEYEDETNMNCYMFVDASGSMGYGESTISKFEYARYLASAFGYLLLMQRDSVGLMTFDTKILDRIEPSTSPNSFRRLTDTLEQLKTGNETSLSGVIEEVLPTIKRRSLIVLFTDCFDNIDALSELLSRLRHGRHEIIVFQIVAPEEEEFPFSKPTQFRNLERQGHRLLVDPHRLREHYLDQYRQFSEQLIKTCGSTGVDYHKLVTTDAYDKALGAYLTARSRSRKKR